MEIIQEKSFYGITFAQQPKMLKYLSGCVSKRENQGLLEYELKNRCYKCWLCVNEPQSYLKYQYSCIYPNLECSYLVIQVGSRGMNDIFGLPRAFVTWDSKLTSTKRPFWSHGGAKHFRRNPSYWDLSHPRWFMPYMVRKMEAIFLWELFN